MKIMDRVRPSVVFHLASLFLATHKSEDVEPLIQSNISFSTQLVEAMTANGVHNLVNTGTSWQHFENREYSPVCLYAATKQAFEQILVFYMTTTPLRVITLKLFDTYGPNDNRRKLFFHLRQAAKEKKILSMSPGHQYLDIVYIDDVVEAYLVAAQRLLRKKGKPMESFAISSGRPIKLKDLVTAYGQTLGIKIPIKWGASLSVS